MIQSHHLAALAVLVQAAVAQVPPAWAPLAVPAGVQQANVQSLGKIVTYGDSGAVHAFSGFARRWVTLGHTGSVRITNDLVLVTEGTTFHAFSAYGAAWSTLPLGPSATVLNPGNQRNDSIWLIQDGADIWAFNAFHGSWARLPTSGLMAALTQRHVAVVVDSAGLHALSAYHGNWVTAPMTTSGAAPYAQGTAGLVVAGSTLHGFSALRNTWSTAPSPGPSPVVTQNDDLVIVAAQGNYVAFSGVRGSFASATVSPAATLLTAEDVAYLGDAAQHLAYSAPRGTWTALPGAASPTVSLSQSAVFLGLPDRVHAYSAMTNTTATGLFAVSTLVSARATAAVVTQSGTAKLYSAIRGRWYDAPPDSVSTAEISDVGGLVRTQTGLAAFNARTGAFTRVNTGPMVSTFVSSASALIAAVDGSTLLVFDARRERWLTDSLAGTPQVDIWRTAMVVTDNGGLRARGFGAFSGRLETLTLPQPATGGRVNSESARIDLPQAIYGFSADPDVLTPWQYPEFHRLFVGGAAMTVHVRGALPGTGFFFLAARVLSNPTPILGLGELELDPTQLLLLSALPVPMPQGHGALSFAVPDLAMLRGLELAFQAVVLPNGGMPYLTQSTSATIF